MLVKIDDGWSIDTDKIPINVYKNALVRGLREMAKEGKIKHGRYQGG